MGKTTADETVYAVMGWPGSGNRDGDCDLIGVWKDREAFEAARPRIEEIGFVIGWGYKVPIETGAPSLKREEIMVAAEGKPTDG